MSNGGCSVWLAGIQVHYCDEDGQRHAAWIDLSEVQAISWTPAEVGRKPPDVPSGPDCEKLPRGTGPLPCDKSDAGAGDSEPFCWWNGMDWVCGEM
jgi:hypothetical protein